MTNQKSPEKRIKLNKRNSLRNRFSKSSIRIFIKKKLSSVSNLFGKKTRKTKSSWIKVGSAIDNTQQKSITVRYEAELVNKTVNFLKQTVRTTYKITQVIYKSGLVQKIIVGFITFIFALTINFSSARPEKPVFRSSTQIERQLKVSSGDLGKFSPGSKARGLAASRTRGSRGMVEAALQNPYNHRRPPSCRRMGQQLQGGPAKDQPGFFGPFSSRPRPDDQPDHPYHSACGRGPRSTTVTVRGQKSADSRQSSRAMQAHDGFRTELDGKSAKHLTSKHGHSFGIDDPAPLPSNQKPTKHRQVRTKTSDKNTQKFGDIVEEILGDTATEVFPNVRIRGIQGRVYYSEKYEQDGVFIGIHTEGPLAGKIVKAQPISTDQLDTLRQSNKVD